MLWLSRDEMRCGGGYSLWIRKPKKDADGLWVAPELGELMILDCLGSKHLAKPDLKPGQVVKIRLTEYGRRRQ